MAEEKQPIVVTHDGGKRFLAKVGNHVLTLDQPVHAGGEDTGPSPVQLLGVSLGACVALYVQQYCESRKLPYEGMRVEVAQYGERNPNRIGQFSVRVMLPHELPLDHADKLEVVARSCPAHNTLDRGAAIDLEIEAPRAAVL